MLEHITRRVEERGMHVNDLKSGLNMCASTARTFKAKASLHGRAGVKIQNSSSLKFHGVTLDANWSFATHVRNLSAKLCSKNWIFPSWGGGYEGGRSKESFFLTRCLPSFEWPARHLPRQGRGFIRPPVLKKVYCTMIRPVAEHAATDFSADRMREKLSVEDVETYSTCIVCHS